MRKWPSHGSFETLLLVRTGRMSSHMFSDRGDICRRCLLNIQSLLLRQ